MKRSIFVVFLVCVFGAGCRRESAPDYDALETQLIVEAVDAMAEGEPGQALNSLRRLDDVRPGEPFVRLALDREEERAAAAVLNRKLAGGDLTGLREAVRRGADEHGDFRVWTTANEVLDALEALRAYRARQPFADVDAARQALTGLRQYEDILGRSATFKRFLADELARLEEMKEERALSDLDQALRRLDRAIVTEGADVSDILLEIAEHEKGDDLSLLYSAIVTGDLQTFRLVLGRAEDGSPTGAMTVELMAWLHRDTLDSRMRGDIEGWLGRHPKARSRCGLLLRAAEAFRKRDPGAVAFLRQACRGLRPGPRTVSSLLEQIVLPREQFQAWCWTSPCPGVSEFLTRLEQLRLGK